MQKQFQITTILFFKSAGFPENAIVKYMCNVYLTYKEISFQQTFRTGIVFDERMKKHFNIWDRCV